MAAIAGKAVKKRFEAHAPLPAGGRRCDASRLRQGLGFVPRVSIERGLELTYAWVAADLAARRASAA